MTLNRHRRAFVAQLTSTAASVLVGSGANWAMAASADSDKEWAFPLLGDLHFDRLDYHDMEWLRKNHPNDVTQVENYSRISREITPKLLAVVRQQVAQPRIAVPFIVQLGDLVEGLCGSEQLATRQSGDAIDLIRKMEFPVPFLFTKGNHDVTGPGAAQVYDRVLVPFMAEQTGYEMKEAKFTEERGGTLLVFYDAYDGNSLEWFSNLLEKQKPRRVIFVIHPPVVPYNARSTWHIYSQPRQLRDRARLLALLGQTRAVVLSGHLHKYSFLVRRTETGRFVQLGLSSVAKSENAKPRDFLEGVEHYGPDLVKLEPRHSPDTEKVRRDVLERERPFIEHFEYADTWGHAMVTMRGENIRAEIHQGLEQQIWKNLDLTRTLG